MKKTTKKAAKPAAKKTLKKTAKPAVKKAVKKTVKASPKNIVKATKPVAKATTKAGRLQPLRLGLAMGVLFAIGALVIHFYPIILDHFWDFEMPRGSSLKFVMSDIYIGYNYGVEWTGLLIGVACAFIDGFLFALLLAWLYNALPIKK